MIIFILLKQKHYRTNTNIYNPDLEITQHHNMSSNVLLYEYICRKHNQMNASMDYISLSVPFVY